MYNRILMEKSKGEEVLFLFSHEDCDMIHARKFIEMEKILLTLEKMVDQLFQSFQRKLKKV